MSNYNEYDKGYNAGRAKTFMLCAVLLATFLAGRYGRDIDLPTGSQAIAAEQPKSPFEACDEIDCVQIPQKPIAGLY